MKTKITTTNLSYQELIRALENNEISKAQVLLELSYIAQYRKDLDGAIKYLELAQKEFLEEKDFIKIAECLSELAICQYSKNQDRIIRSHTLLNDARCLIESQETSQNAKVLLLSIIYNHQGKIAYFEKHYADSLKLFKKALENAPHKSIEYARILDNMAIFYLRSNNYQIATQYLERAIDIKRLTKNRRELSLTLALAGRLYSKMENYKKALSSLVEAINLTEDYEISTTTIRNFNEISNTYILNQDIEQAEEYCNKAIEAVEKLDCPINKGFSYCIKANLLLNKNENSEALDLIQNTIKPIFRDYRNIRGIALYKHLEGLAFYKLNNYQSSVESLHESIEYFSESSMQQETAVCYYDLAATYNKQGNKNMTVSCLLEGLRLAKINELPILIKQIEDCLYDVDVEEWSKVINKTAKKEKLFTENKSLLETLDLVSNMSINDTNVAKDPLLALLRIGRSIAAETDVDTLLEIIAEETRIALNSDRCTVFLLDKDKDELWSKIALGMGSQEIRFSAKLGLAGHVVRTGETINIKDAYNDERFNKEIDKKTGYNTQTILCMPMRNINQEIVGVFQVLNKLTESHFTDEDEDLLVAIGSSAGIALENARLFKKQQFMYQEQKKSLESFIKTLAASIDARDKITAGHSIRVSGYSVLLAHQLKLSHQEVEEIKYASVLHDIGKLGIKDVVLCKEGKLTPEEYDHIKEHPKITFDILNKMYFEEQYRNVPLIAATHHEKYDGSGYFMSLNGENIPLGGRILAVADVFDAITSKRHYRDRMAFSQVLKILKGDSGTHFDGSIVDAFFNIPTDKIIETLIEGYDVDFEKADKKVLKTCVINDIYQILQKEELNEQETLLLDTFKKYYTQG